MKILVTGGSGYIASWIINYLLKQGHEVNTTVRDISKEAKIFHLKQMMKEKEGELRFFEADLLEEGSFDEAVKDCEVVIHSASPFKVSGIKDPVKQLVEPAVKGTRNVLRAVNRSKSVKKVVLTSSVAAIYGDNADIHNIDGSKFTEDHWNTSSSEKHQAYSYSKTEAEKTAWHMANEQQRWKLAVINPGFVVGPSITKRKDSTSINLIISFLDGTYKSGVPELYFGMVDVRNAAMAHVNAATKPDAEGRHILVSETLSMLEVAKILRKHHGNAYKIPGSAIPKWLLYVVGPFNGFNWKFIRRNVGIPVYFDNTRAKNNLDIEFIPVSQSIREQADQVISDGLVER